MLDDQPMHYDWLRACSEERTYSRAKSEIGSWLCHKNCKSKKRCRESQSELVKM